MGIVFQVGIQVALNIGVVSDLLPNTGISLPFFSAGGTSLIILLCEMGMVLSVSRSARKKG
jgi:cell division protein FtsW